MELVTICDLSKACYERPFYSAFIRVYSSTNYERKNLHYDIVRVLLILKKLPSKKTVHKMGKEIRTLAMKFILACYLS